MCQWLVVLLFMCAVRPAHAQAPAPPETPAATTALADQAFDLFVGSAAAQQRVLDLIVASKRREAAPILILALRFAPGASRWRIVAALEELTGEKPGADWNAWMLWQEANPGTGVVPGFGKLQARVYDLIDPNFQSFLTGREAHSIRLEEIAWGGVSKDGIPALTNPKLIAAGEAGYLGEGDLVFGIEIGGDARAYPLRIMDWHEMLNDVVGGVPVSLAYCTLCGSGILFETAVPGRARPFVFGSSGFLYRSNKLMYDRETHSLWNQFTGRPVVGALTGSGIELKTRAVVITTWAQWRARHPATRVLSADTGHRRDYNPGAAYGTYFASPDLMFPTRIDTRRLKAKDYVFALRGQGEAKAWPLSLFEGGAVIADKAGTVDVVLIGDAATRTVRAYRSEGLVFEKADAADRVRQGADVWTVTEEALQGPGGRTLARLPGHIAYWFAWNNYYGAAGTLAEPRKR